MAEGHPQVARAHALHPLLAQEGDEIDSRRELTPAVVKALKEGGFFRMLQPRSIGGMEMKPSDFARVTEAISAADGSTGGKTVRCIVSPATNFTPRALLASDLVWHAA